MTTLSDIRSRVRKDLRDVDASDERWDDAQLDRHIGRALADVGLAAPQEKTATLATTAGSRDLATSSLTGFITLEAAEFPIDHYPRAYAPFALWAGTITLNVVEEPGGENARLYYLAKHTLDGSGSSLPEEFEDVLATGAGGYAAIEYASYTIDRLSTGDAVAERFRAWGEARLTVFREMLRVHARERRVGSRRLFTPA